MKKTYLFLSLAVAILILAVFWVNKKGQELNQPVNFIKSSQPVIMENPELSKSPEEIAVFTEPLKDEVLPTKYSNTLAFTSQAPYAKWDNLHDEACEEASLIMTHHYLLGTEKLELRETEDELQAMVTFQKEYFGSHKDLTAEEMIELAQEFYSEEYQLIEFRPEESLSKTNKETTKIEMAKDTVTFKSEEETTKTGTVQSEINWEENLEYMKKELSKGNLFIAPMAGQELENPYFRVPGPLYHVLVITGFDNNKKEFITHDPGTRRGQDFHYSYEIIQNAIHDFPGKKSDILEGAKNIILVKKEYE